MKKAELTGKSDEELMEIYKVGNAIAFEILFERHAGRVLAYLGKKMRGDLRAQDLTQDTFLKLHRFKDQYNTTLPFLPWLFSIAKTTWLDFLKKQKLDYEVSQLVPDFELPADLLNSGGSQEVLDLLPADQKSAVSLRVLDDATFEEIAIKLSTSPENARQLFSRGIKKLREKWKI